MSSDERMHNFAEQRVQGAATIRAKLWSFFGGGVSELISWTGLVPKPDWVGRAILERWLAGGGDWFIRRDRPWKDYMMNSEVLRVQLLAEFIREVSTKLAHDNSPGTYMFRRRFQATTGVQSATPTGYGYLHGTDWDAGGFEMSGTYWVQLAPDGGRVVAARLEFDWHDKINPAGSQDAVGVALGEILSVGAARSYEIVINWDSMIVLRFDVRGRLTGHYGYPGQTNTDMGRTFPPYHYPSEYQR